MLVIPVSMEPHPTERRPNAVMRIAVMSDLHCQLETGRVESLLCVGSLRIPAPRHPVQALLKLIHEERMKADSLLVPGDLTNKGEREGLSQAWDYALEVGRALGSEGVFPVLGNHDIESRRSPGNRGHDPAY